MPTPNDIRAGDTRNDLVTAALAGPQCSRLQFDDDDPMFGSGTETLLIDQQAVDQSQLEPTFCSSGLN
jgi:hypothetical protein